jgi:hypothetical protein
LPQKTSSLLAAAAAQRLLLITLSLRAAAAVATYGAQAVVLAVCLVEPLLSLAARHIRLRLAAAALAAQLTALLVQILFLGLLLLQQAADTAAVKQVQALMAVLAAARA